MTDLKLQQFTTI